MCNATKTARILDLVQGNLLGHTIPYVANATIGEHVPLDLQFAKDFLQLGQYVVDNLRLSNELQVVHMFGEHGGEATMIMAHT